MNFIESKMESNASKASERKMSKFCLVPLPEREPKIPLREGTTEIGRKTLTEELHITSQTHPKKMSVSRVQVTITVSSDNIMLQSVGLNSINLLLKGRMQTADRGKPYPVYPGDTFTLCGAHFPFEIATSDGYIRPNPAVGPSSSVSKRGLESSEMRGGESAKRNRTHNAAVQPSSIRNSTDDSSRQTWQHYYHPESYQPQLKREPSSIYNEEKRFKKEDARNKNRTLEKPKLHRDWSVGMRVETEYKGQTKAGTITSYDSKSSEYEITFDNGKVIKKLDDQIHVLQQFVRKKPNGKLTSSGSVENIAKKRKSSPARSDGEYNNGNGSGKKNRSSGDSNSDSDDIEKTRRSARQRTPASYFEWPSDLSSSDSESNEERRMRSNKPPRVRTKKTNYQALEPLLADEKTAVMYSEITLKHYVPKWHLERPSRISQIMSGIRTLEHHFPEHFDVIEEFPPVNRSLLLEVHDESYIKKMEISAPTSSQDIPTHATQFSQIDDRPEEQCDTFMSHFSFEAALMAVGAVLRAIDLVSTGEYRNAFCAIRPPGHHCGRKGHTAEASSQGYCILNNVAIGAHYAVKTHGYKKVAVLDFDVHHGNGTEEILANQEQFLFISIHVGGIYPGTGKDHPDRANNIINIDLEPESGSDVFRKAFVTKVIPSLKQFQPDFLILSSGFDGHKQDPTDDGLRLEEADYSFITEKITAFAEQYCHGKIVSVLEGGYNLPSLRKCVKEHVLSLMKKVTPESVQKLEQYQPPKVASPNVATSAITSLTSFDQIQPSTSNGDVSATSNLAGTASLQSGPEVVRVMYESSGSLQLSI